MKKIIVITFVPFLFLGCSTKERVCVPEIQYVYIPQKVEIPECESCKIHIDKNDTSSAKTKNISIAIECLKSEIKCLRESIKTYSSNE